jgi:hypothetical protein
MHKLNLLAVVCGTIVIGAGHSTERSGTCAPIRGAKRAVVRSSSLESLLSDYVCERAPRGVQTFTEHDASARNNCGVL